MMLFMGFFIRQRYYYFFVKLTGNAEFFLSVYKEDADVENFKLSRGGNKSRKIYIPKLLEKKYFILFSFVLFCFTLFYFILLYITVFIFFFSVRGSESEFRKT